MLLALDRMPSLNRSFDKDGRLHVRAAPISRVGISRYLGREIRGHRKLGLALDREYSMFRSAAELAKAAATFRGIPVTSRHASLAADNCPDELVIGCCDAPHFDGEFLRGNLTIWEPRALRAIERGERRQLSAGYGYSMPRMIPGRYRGESFDGRMVDLCGHHIATVQEGKAGADCAI